MTLLIDVFAVLALLLLAFLLYLVLFERGASYRTSVPVHHLDDAERMQVLSGFLGASVQSIRTLQVLKEGPDLYQSELDAIRVAKRSVHIEAYIFHAGKSADAVLSALCERARAGVRVRIVIDAIGSLLTTKSYFAPLVAAGGKVYRYNPLHWHMARRWNNRTHRNLVVVDGDVAFIGGAGVADYWNREQPRPWRDCVLRVTGPIVTGLQSVFAENWLECAGELLVGPDSLPVMVRDDGPAEYASGIVVGSTPTGGRSTRARVLAACRT